MNILAYKNFVIKVVAAGMILLGTTFFILSACGDSKLQENKKDNEKKLTVAVSILPQKTFVKKIAGDLVDIVLLVPPGYSPANYEPAPKEMKQFSNASLYFSIGVPTEEANIMPRAKEMEELEIVNLNEKVAESYPERKLFSRERDPHIWLSPQRARAMVEIMADKMASLDPENKDKYQKNASMYISKLTSLEEELDEIFSRLENNKFIVFHPAFGYLADDFDLQMYSLEFEGKDATPGRMKEMVDLAIEEDIRVIFYQDEIDSKQSEAFAEEIGGKAVKLNPLSPHYIDNLKRMAQTMVEVLDGEK